MKILVADDFKANLAFITTSLNKLGHQVISVENGEEAIDLFKSDRPDLVILAIEIAEKNSFEYVKKIRAMSSDDWIPIIFLCSSIEDKRILQAIDAGGDDYLINPGNEITLIAKIKAMQRITEMKYKLFEATEKLFLISSTDPLTGLYNRLEFDQVIKEILMTADNCHKMIALLFIDLDNFKNINDSFGHHVGDLLLIEMAKRLRENLRANDFICRLGGDEFAIVLTEIDSPKAAAKVAQTLLNMLALDYNLNGHNIRTAASIGIACYPAPATTRENLILNADVAMYHAKASGRNNYKEFSEELNAKYQHKISVEYALKFALERNELYLTYQPIFEIKSNQLVGIEALLCWDHPQYGMVPPSTFIPIAEETGLISHIGTWVLRTACEEFAKWGLNNQRNFKFNINVSAHQLLHENFFQALCDIIADTKIDSKKLELELTETVVMSYTSIPFKETIKKICDKGISIAIDDFGTGYSSLMRLKHLPIRTLKIEKSFIRDSLVNQNGAIIVNCLIALGKNLGMNVIAEGIETSEQLQFLKEKECPQGQGFYLSRPLDSKQISEFVKQHFEKNKISE